jgi:hypothetical protein
MSKQRDAAEQVAEAAMTAFEPLVRLFLDLGLSSPEAESLMQAVYVHETRRILRERYPETKDVSHMKVAMLSGVNRNKVRKILSGDAPKVSLPREKWANHAGRILQAWQSDAEYLEKKSKNPKPVVLTFRDNSSLRPTFWTLCKKHWASAWPRTILEELVRIKAVRLTASQKNPDDDQIEFLRDPYGRANARVAALEQLGARTRDLLSTLIHNLDSAPDERRVVETIENRDVDPEFAKVLRRMFKDRAEAHTESMNSELNSVSAKSEKHDRGRQLRMGMTIYAFEQGSPALEEAGRPEKHGAKKEAKKGVE